MFNLIPYLLLTSFNWDSECHLQFLFLKLCKYFSTWQKLQKLHISQRLISEDLVCLTEDLREMHRENV